MSNNKQSMKLYTETEILSLIKIHLADEEQADSFVALLTPIVLPSDEEIKDCTYWHGLYKAGFFDGVKWIRNEIQGGNNEQQ